MTFDLTSKRLKFTKLVEADWELFRSIHSDCDSKLNQHILTVMSEEAIQNTFEKEAASRVTEFATDTFAFEMLTAVCSEEHQASRRVLEKVGMKLDEIVPENTEINGRLVNDCFYSMELV